MRLVHLSYIILLLFVALEVSSSGTKKKQTSQRPSQGSQSSSNSQRPSQGSQSSSNSQRPSQGSQSSSNPQRPSQRPQGSQGSQNSQSSQKPQTSQNRPVTRNGCKFSMHSDVKFPGPLILTRVDSGIDFLYPGDKSHKIRLQSSQKMILACPGELNFIKNLPLQRRVKVIEVECVNEKLFSIDSKSFSIKNIECNDEPVHVARRTQMRCHGNGKHVEIGFDISKNFFRTIDVCWDDDKLTTYWTKFSLTPKIRAIQWTERPRFWEGRNFYGTLDVSMPYSLNVQLETMKNLVGSEELAKKYIDNDKQLFISRGHLTARNDFVYGAAQRATFWYINAYPQWHSFNDGNWHQLEFDVRDFVATRTSPLIVYTGVHGQMSVKDINDVKKPAYLHINGDKKAFPVPKFFWKIIYDPLTKEGTAFVGVNDPWATIDDDNIQLCTDISSEIPWLTWEADNAVKGLSYACKVEDLKQSVSTVPNILVRNILA